MENIREMIIKKLENNSYDDFLIDKVFETLDYNQFGESDLFDMIDAKKELTNDLIDTLKLIDKVDILSEKGIFEEIVDLYYFSVVKMKNKGCNISKKNLNLIYGYISYEYPDRYEELSSIYITSGVYIDTEGDVPNNLEIVLDKFNVV